MSLTITWTMIILAAAGRKLYLAAFAADGFMDMAVRELTDKIVSSETQAVIESESRKIPFRMTPVILANEPNARAREELEAKRQEVLKELNPLRKERIERLHSLAGDLGYGNYRLLYANINRPGLRCPIRQDGGILGRDGKCLHAPPGEGSISLSGYAAQRRLPS